ncbi:MAG: polysaccharide pyruvyl transferase family protein [Lachnospiraceae bacterium]|nr:polysaccharide pyruvyl transferase family protein [Lachnospiraceae bacterium]
MNEKVVLLDPTIGSFNKGDEVIINSFKQVMKSWLRDKDVYSLPTHLPICTENECRHMNERMEFFQNQSLKFLVGTDIIAKGRMYLYNQWNVNHKNYLPLSNTICLAVGLSAGVPKPRINPFNKIIFKKNTKDFYQNIFSHDYIHSTRDEATAEYLRELGFQAVNTGCVTTWMLTPAFCKSIPTNKSDSVIFTLNCRKMDQKNDIQLIGLLQKLYNHLYFFPQQWKDIEYFNSLSFSNKEQIQMIPINIEALQSYFQREVDYVGLRLHCGIFAMQHRKRSIIIEVDHRSSDLSKDQNLNLAVRGDLLKLEAMIHSELVTDIHVNYENINTFLSQFGVELIVTDTTTNIKML